MGPVFEHALVDALRLLEVAAAIGRDAAIEDVMVAALDHVDGVDLHIAEVLDRGRDRSRSLAERRRHVQPLCLQPDAARQGFGQEVGFGLAGHSPGTYPDSASRAARTASLPPAAADDTARRDIRGFTGRLAALGDRALVDTAGEAVDQPGALLVRRF